MVETRRSFLEKVGGAALGMSLLSLPRADAMPQRKPNIIVILADDVGYGDVQSYGCTDIPTPCIDRIGQNGVRFTDGYVASPICSPSRAAVMTGRYSQKFGHWYNTGGVGNTAPNFGLPLSEMTLASALKPAGYTCGCIGKWHLGLAPEMHPMKRGFDEFFGFLHVLHSYTNPDGQPGNPILRNLDPTPVEEKEYLTDAFTREAVDFITRHKKEPFFLYLAYNAVHRPFEATEKYLNRFKNIADPQRRVMAAMISALDDGVGRVLGSLNKENLADNTLVFFLSDNGGCEGGSRNTPLCGAKNMLYEGGIRVPFLMQWPAAIPASKACHAPIISMDIFATGMAAAGLELAPSLDGKNLLPFITGKNRQQVHDYLFWDYLSTAAVRSGNWKLLKADGKTRLVDFGAGTDELTDVSEHHAGIKQDLLQKLAEWEATLQPPLWASSVPVAGTILSGGNSPAN